jgi:hypothetical protein
MVSRCLLWKSARKLAGLSKKDRVRWFRSIAQYGGRPLGRRKDAGDPLEATGYAGDLEGQSAVGLIRREIDAIASVGEIDLQQTPVKEAKQAGTSHIGKIELGRAGASGGRLRSIGARLDQSKRERTLRAISRERHLHGILLCIDAGGTKSDHQCHGCCEFHWSSPGAGGATGTVPVPQPGVGRKHKTGAAPDEPPGGGSHPAACGARREAQALKAA